MYRCPLDYFTEEEEEEEVLLISAKGTPRNINTTAATSASVTS
jgi:hypothetical protein